MQRKNAEERWRLGEEYFKGRRFKEAVEQFQEYIWLNPSEPAGHHSLGAAYCELGEFAQAIDPFLRALRLGPESSEVYHNLGLAYSELQQHKNAASAFQSAIRLEPDKAEYCCRLASSYLHLNKPTEAVQSAQEALRLKPDSADAYLQFGCGLHCDSKTFVEAAAAYQKSLALEPGQFVALANLGDVNLQLGRVEEARDCLVLAGNINPKDPRLHHLLGQVYLRLGRLDDARRENDVLKSLDPGLADVLAKSLDDGSNA